MTAHLSDYDSAWKFHLLATRASTVLLSTSLRSVCSKSCSFHIVVIRRRWSTKAYSNYNYIYIYQETSSAIVVILIAERGSIVRKYSSKRPVERCGSEMNCKYGDCFHLLPGDITMSWVLTAFVPYSLYLLLKILSKDESYLRYVRMACVFWLHISSYLWTRVFTSMQLIMD